MTFTNRKSLVALLLTLCMIVSLFTVAVSADDTTAAPAEDVVEVVSGEDVSVLLGSTAESSTTESASDVATEAKTEEASKETTTEKKEDSEIDDLIAETTGAMTKKKNALIINAIIIAVIIVICVVVAIKFREKLGAFLRSVKSELGKIVWSSKENTRKGFLVVIVAALAIAAIIFVFDLTFSSGIGFLGKLFK